MHLLLPVLATAPKEVSGISLYDDRLYLDGRSLSPFYGSPEEALVAEEYPELYWIAYCENREFNPTKCSYKGCDAGQGLVQIIPKTLEYCETKLNRDLSVIDPIDNLDCGKWLYHNEGLKHWNPSRDCWEVYYN